MNETIQNLLREAIAAHQKSDMALAEQRYNEILAIDSNHPDANHNTGVIKASIGKYEAAKTFFLKAVNAMPSFAPYWQSYIKVHMQMGNIHDAKRSIAEARKNGILQTDLKELQDHIDKQLVKNRKIYEVSNGKTLQLTDSIKLQMDNLISERKFENLLQASKRLLREFSGEIEVYNYMGIAYSALDLHEKSIEAFREALKLEPNHSQTKANMGIAFHRKGDLENSISYFQQAIQINKNDPETHFSLGNVYLEVGELESASLCFAKTIDLNPRHAEAYYKRGLCELKDGKKKLAKKSYLKALELKEDHVAALFDLGVLAEGENNYKEAIKNYKSAINFRPDFAEAYNNMGACALKIGTDQEEAKNYLRKAIDINPNSASTHCNLGVSLERENKWAEAKIHLKKAIELEPDFLKAYVNLGLVERKSNEFDKAEGTYLKALDLDKKNSEAKMGLGLVLFAKGRYSEAASAFRGCELETARLHLLRSCYFSDQKSEFFEVLHQLMEEQNVTAILGSMISRASVRFDTKISNPFCNNPFDYLYQKNLRESYNFDEVFIKPALEILNQKDIHFRKQALLKNGKQTAGNIFEVESETTKKIKESILIEVENYRIHFASSKEGFLVNWPEDYDLFGWLINIQSGGNLRPHMHENGWLSGSVYLNVPKKYSKNEGDLALCIEEKKLVDKERYQERIVTIDTGDLCLFPASLLHWTLPFASEENRTVLAFDIFPKDTLSAM